MKKYLPYILMLLLLSVLMGWYLLSRNTSTLNTTESDFKIREPLKVGRIVLHDDEKRTIDLVRKNDVWSLNGKYTARPDLISQLLDIMSHLESEAPVSKAAHENVIRSMLASNIQVQIYYEGESQPEKVYYVGGPTIDNKGTYFLMEVDGKPAERPYIVRIPGLDSYLTPAYEMEEDVWRNRTVFSNSIENLKEINVQYPLDKTQSFSVEYVGKDSLVLRNYAGQVEPIKQGYLFAYATMFSDVQIESFENNNEEKTFVLRDTPFAIITLTDKGGKETTAKLYYMPVNRRSKKPYDDQGNEYKMDIDKLYVSFNNGKDFGVAQMYVWGRILRSFQDFTTAGNNAPPAPKATL